MLFKNTGEVVSHLSPFNLLGHNEEALAKILAFILSKDKEIFSDFLKICGIKTVITQALYTNSSIKSEIKYDSGRTDIEIDLGGKEHIIIETKVRNNKAKEEQLDRYQSINEKDQVILISSRKEYSKYKNVTWDEILSQLSKKHEHKELFKEFYNFYQYNYYGRTQYMQEILTQDLAIPSEIQRYLEGCIYKGHARASWPLYFAPYFTRKSGQQEGISYISKVLFVMQSTPMELNQVLQDTAFCEKLKKYASEALNSSKSNELVEKWIAGIKIESDNPHEKCTYYFLDFPQQLPFPLRKETDKGKGWISRTIPKHRMLSFDQIFYQMAKQKLQ